MDTLEKAITQLLKAESKKREKNKDFQAKKDFFLKMKENGLSIPQEYGIAPIDTIGKRRYQSHARKRGQI